MRKLRFCAVAAGGLMLFAAGPAALASSGGKGNAGDVWLDNVGQAAGPGHEMDPHLACQDINLWGDGLADASGTYTISGWPPSGKQEQDYPATGTASWTYDTATGGDQVVSVISVQTLIQNAQANGDTPSGGQGYHFQLEFSQDPQKHKTFWVNCTSPPSPPVSGSSGSSSTCPVSSQATPREHGGEGHPLGASKKHGKHKGVNKQSGSGRTESSNCNSGATRNTTSPTTGTTPATTGASTPTSSVSGTSVTRHTTLHKRNRAKRRRQHGLRHSTLARRAVLRHAGFTG